MIRKLHGITAALLLLHGAPSSADDIEVYLNGDAASGAPYLHLMLDYRPSVFNTLCTYSEVAGSTNKVSSCAPPFMSETAFANLTAKGYTEGQKVSTFAGFIAVMESVITNPLYDPIRLAIIAPNINDGGTILKGYTQLGTGREEILKVLNAIPEATTGGEAHKLSPKETYLEWHRYINGRRVLNGTLTQGNFTAVSTDTPVPDYDSTIIEAGGPYGNYDSPFDSVDECPKIYSMLIAMNTENQDDDWNDVIKEEMSTMAAAKQFENMMSWLHRVDTDLLPALTATVPLQKSWVISDSGSVGATRDWAAAGGSGSPLNLEDPKALEEELANAFTEVIAVSSTFVAASVPVNVFNQSKSLDNLFVALFEAQPTMDWPGNLKKLRLADTFDPADPNNPAARDGIYDEIVDVNGKPGFESTGDNKGRITFDAVTYWTDVDTLPAGDGETIANGADGREVARGGGGQKIDGFVNYDPTKYFIGDTNGDDPVDGYKPRQVFVEPASIVNGAQNSFAAFDATETMAANLKFLLDPNDPDITEEAALNLIKWGRGQDVANGSSSARQWILGDPMHSRPFALNYGTAGGYTEDNPNIRLLIGTGDGLFHILENTDKSNPPVETGREVFAFYPRELLKNIKLRMENNVSALKMEYGVDGEPVVYTYDENSDGTLDHTAGDKAYAYVGLRRGGNSYYALDVSNPDDTRLLWKITQTSGGDFDELGMTFSTPVVGKVRYDGSDVDVLVFAGGYNGGWNAARTERIGKDLDDSDDTVGNAIYVVNAHTGALIWKAIQGSTGASTNTTYEHSGLVDSIPAKVTVLENLNGNIHRVYVGDTGGAIWRVDLPEGDGSNDKHRKDNWFITKIAELGSDGGSSDRRFFHALDIVETYDELGPFDGLLIESGDRAHPNETDVDNYMFYIKDRRIATGDPLVKAENEVTNPPGRYVFDSTKTNGLTDKTRCIIGTETGCDVYPANGWKIEMQRSGEKGLSAPLVDAGRVFFTTYRPGTIGTCEPSEGQGSIYLVNLADGAAVANNQRIYDIGPGIPPGAILIGDVILLPGGGIDVYDLDGDGDRDISKLPQSLTKKIYQIYWREPGVDKL